ncbi:putative transcription factor C2H2 family [Helianthus annuus]|nr:putative transcription factor C2H2 family [Helianthus annuus]
MSSTTVTGDDSDSYTTDSNGKSDGGISYVLGLTLFFILIIIIISYVSYKCTRSTNSQSAPEGDDHQLMTVYIGVDEDVLMTFPKFTYAEKTTSIKSDSIDDVNDSSCSICLVDYKPEDVVRLLPDCGHLFHCNCIDTWLKANPTCPVCRNSPLPLKLEILRS